MLLPTLLPPFFLLFCLTKSLHRFAIYCLSDTQGGIPKTKNSIQTFKFPKLSSPFLLYIEFKLS